MFKTKKVILSVVLILLLASIVMATYKRDIYDYQGSWTKEKINYSFMSAININVTDDVCIVNGTCLSSAGGVNMTLINETIDDKLLTTYNSPSSVSSRAGTIIGTVNLINYSDVSVSGRTVNITEVSGSPGLDIRMNFTGINDFNKGIVRYYTSTLKGDYPIVQLWDYTNSVWDDHPIMSESLSYGVMEAGVFDSHLHVSDGIVQMRLYKSSNGNTNNNYFVDWVSIIDGPGTPSGEEVDPYSVHKTGDTMTGHLTVNAEVIINNSGYGMRMNSTRIVIGNISYW